MCNYLNLRRVRGRNRNVWVYWTKLVSSSHVDNMTRVDGVGVSYLKRRPDSIAHEKRLKMECLPDDLWMKVFSSLDHHQDLVAAQQVCRKWKLVASQNELWSNLFTQRWGIDRATFYAPVDSKSWKHVYAVQHRCDRVGLGLKIVREGDEYFLIHQGEIQKHLGSRSLQPPAAAGDETRGRNDRQMGILDRILFFIGDLETDSASAKRGRLL